MQPLHLVLQDIVDEARRRRDRHRRLLAAAAHAPAGRSRWLRARRVLDELARVLDGVAQL